VYVIKERYANLIADYRYNVNGGIVGLNQAFTEALVAHIRPGTYLPVAILILHSINRALENHPLNMPKAFVERSYSLDKPRLVYL